MRLLRALLLLLLSLTLPLHGMAALVAVELPCAMEQPLVQARHPVATHGAPCCNDAEAAARTGQLCKSGQDCKSLSFALGPPAETRRVRQRQLPGPVLRPVGRLDAARTTIWRPPLLS